MTPKLKIIDVSKHNGYIDWSKVAKSEVDGVIIRAGYGRFISQKDPTFEYNYEQAKAAGLHVGAYWYSYAISEEEASLEAEVFLKILEDKQFDLPVYLDIEEGSQASLSKQKCSNIAKTFMTILENNGYFCGIYSFDSFFYDNLSTEIQKLYSIWVARVEYTKPKLTKSYAIHQFSWKGNIDGIVGDVDLNDCYVNFPEIITQRGFNGYGNKSQNHTITATVTVDSLSEAKRIEQKLAALGMDIKIQTS